MLKNFWHTITDTPHDDIQYYRDLLTQANDNLRKMKTSDAQKAYQKILKDIPRIKQPAQEFLNVLSNAYLGIGYILQSENKNQEAVQSFLLARNNTFTLPQEVLRFVASEFAQHNQLTAQAITIYKEYLAGIDDKSNQQDVVVGFLKKYLMTCFEPKATSEQVRSVMELASDLSKANSGLEWTLFPLGYSQGRLGNYTVAIQTLLLAERYNPGRAATPFYIGYFYTSIGDHNNAYISYKRSLALDPTNADACFLLARSIIYTKPEIGLLTKEQVNEASDHLVRATNRNPNRADFWYTFGLIKNSTGDKVQAKEALARAVSLERNNYTYHVSYARLLADIGELEQAIAVYRVALQIDPGKYDTNLSLAKLLYQVGKYVDALTYFSRADQIQGGQEEVLIGIGSCQYQQQHLEEAIRNLKRVQHHSEESSLQLARSFSLTHDYRTAVQSYKKHLTEFGSNGLVFYYLGLALSHLNQWAEALNAFEQAQILSPTHLPSKVDVVVAQANTLLTLQQPENAERLLRTELEKGNPDFRLVYLLATALMKQDRWEEVNNILDCYNELINKYPMLVFQKALVLEHFHNWKDAADTYAIYLSLPDQAVDITLGTTRQGVCLAKDGSYEAAAKLLKSCSSLDIKNRFWLALSLTHIGQLEEAKSFWEELHKEDPQNNGLTNALLWTLFELGKHNFELSNYDQAISTLKQCQTIEVDNEAVKACLEESYFRQTTLALKMSPDKVMPEVRVGLEAANQLDQSDPRIIFYQGLEALFAHDVERAISFFDRISNEQWGNALPDYYRTVSLLQAGRIDDARNQFESLEHYISQLWPEYHLLAANLSAISHNWEMVHYHINAALDESTVS